MVTENMVVLPETFNWLTKVNRKHLSQSGTKWVLELSTKLPQSQYDTNIYINPDQLIYLDDDGNEMQVEHTRIVPEQDGGNRVETYTNNLVEERDLVFVELSRGNLKEKNGVSLNADYCSSYWWNLESLSPGEGTPLTQANLNTPRQQVNSPRSANATGSGDGAGQNPTFEVRGDIKGHCEKIIAQLAVAKLLPGLEAEDGGIDWGLFRQYRDEYFHNVSNVPVEPLPSEEAEEVVEED
jgi:hypothetical protein